MVKRPWIALPILVLLAWAGSLHSTLAINNNLEHETWNVEHSCLAGDNKWTWCSQGLWGGAVSALGVSPGYATDHTLFAGTSGGGGVFKSTNGGASWNHSLPNRNIYALALSPGYTTDRTLFAGSWSDGVFKSTDGGDAWSVPRLSHLWIRALALSPGYASDRTLFAGTYGGGVFKSTDSGASWSAVNTDLTNLNVEALALSPGYATDHTIFAGTNGGGVFKSTDGGASWSAMNNGLTTLAVLSLALSPGYATDHTIFAGTNGGGVFKSTDGGGAWSAVNTSLTNPNVSAIVLSPAYVPDQTLFAGTRGGGVFRSGDGGASWSDMNEGLVGNIYISSLVITNTSPYTCFTGTSDGRVWQYTLSTTAKTPTGTPTATPTKTRTPTCITRVYLPLIVKNYFPPTLVPTSTLTGTSTSTPTATPTRTHTPTRIVRVYLPIIVKNYFPPTPMPTSTPTPRPIQNPSFEDGLNYWQTVGVVAPNAEWQTNGQYSARLGDPSYRCDGGGIVGKNGVTQTFDVPSTGSTTLAFDYKIVTEDSLLENGDYLQIEINDGIVGRIGWQQAASGCLGQPNIVAGTYSVDLLGLGHQRGASIKLGVFIVIVDQYYNTYGYIDNMRWGAQ